MDRESPSVPITVALTGTALIRGETYTLYNADSRFVRFMPTAEEAPVLTNATAQNFISPTTISNIVPYIIFIPAHTPWHGPLLGRLSFTSDKIPIVKDSSGRWGLSQNVRDQWQTLELNLIHLCNGFRHVHTLPIPADIHNFGYPYRAGYTSSHKTFRAARAAAMRAIDGFLPLIGQVSMFLYLYKRNSEKEGWENWRKRVCERANLEEAWLTAVEDSAIGDFTIPRIGGILDLGLPPNTDPISVRRTELDFLVGAIITDHLPMPLYVRWGTISDTPEIPVPKYLEAMKFVPDWREIKYLKSLPGKVKFSTWARKQPSTETVYYSSLRDSYPFVNQTAVRETPSFPPVTAPSSLAPESSFPPVERYSGQKAGETMEQFFARRALSNEATCLREDSRQKHSRLERENHARKGQVPGGNSKAARVYIWELCDGHYIRRAAGRSNYEDVWNDSSPSQRKYDSFHNEWDVYVRALVVLPHHSCKADLGRMHPLRDDTDAPRLPTLLQSAQDVAYFRFGCMLPNEVVRPDAEALPNATVTAKVLGDKDIALPSAPKDFNLRTFLAECQQFWAFDVKRLQCAQVLEFGGGGRYVMQDIDSPGPLYLVLEGATTLLEIIRRKWGPTVLDVARELVDRCIPFHLCILAYSPRLPAPSKPILPEHLLPEHLLWSGLGYRSMDYEPSLWDYRSYLDTRWRFLRSPRGQIALRCGGIIARIARDVLAVEDALLGPSDTATDDGLCFWDGRNSTALWDDQLTPNEIDIICGVYHIATGQRDPTQKRGRQTTTQSWWPRPHIYAVSALNVGWWSPALGLGMLSVDELHAAGPPFAKLGKRGGCVHHFFLLITTTTIAHQALHARAAFAHGLIRADPSAASTLRILYLRFCHTLFRLDLSALLDCRPLAFGLGVSVLANARVAGCDFGRQTRAALDGSSLYSLLALPYPIKYGPQTFRTPSVSPEHILPVGGGYAPRSPSPSRLARCSQHTAGSWALRCAPKSRLPPILGLEFFPGPARILPYAEVTPSVSGALRASLVVPSARQRWAQCGMRRKFASHQIRAGGICPTSYAAASDRVTAESRPREIRTPRNSPAEFALSPLAEGVPHGDRALTASPEVVKSALSPLAEGAPNTYHALCTPPDVASIQRHRGEVGRCQTPASPKKPRAVPAPLEGFSPIVGDDETAAGLTVSIGLALSSISTLLL
ncbi:hypothetical protein MVEN_00302900 [Mycena venus]|uniref:Uncharacterized protein n=1 Tax=Mycena venus TaxID=2733690 RepID=A0A8H7DBU1_9AGAR|nr:hypothetical protein MVEN_00302900 [Mycena venus]